MLVEYREHVNKRKSQNIPPKPLNADQTSDLVKLLKNPPKGEENFLLLKKTKNFLINIGTGQDKSIKDYVDFIIKKLDLKVKVKFDKSKPNGVPRKVLDISLAKKYGWKPKISLNDGFDITYQDFLKKKNNYK